MNQRHKSPEEKEHNQRLPLLVMAGHYAISCNTEGLILYCISSLQSSRFIFLRYSQPLP